MWAKLKATCLHSLTIAWGYMLALVGGGMSLIDGIADTIPTIGWDSVTVGLGYASGVAASDLMIDDVAVAIYADTSPGIHIGCARDP